MNTKNDWIKMTDRRPTEQDLPVWVWPFGDNGAPVIFHNLAFSGNSSVSHWRSAAQDIPEPPREETQEEKDRKAFNGFWCNNTSSPLPFGEDAWHAALAWERAEVAKILPSVPYHELSRLDVAKYFDCIRARCAGGVK